MSRFLLLNFEDFSLNQDITKTIQPHTPVCVCCLQTNVPFINLVNCNHSSFLDTYFKLDLKPHKYVACQQCHGMLVKIKSFKQQVENSLQQLQIASFNIAAQKTKTRLNIHKTVDVLLSPATPNERVLIDVKKSESTSENIDTPSNESTDLKYTRKLENIKKALEIINNNRSDDNLAVLNMGIQCLKASNLLDIGNHLDVSKRPIELEESSEQKTDEIQEFSIKVEQTEKATDSETEAPDQKTEETTEQALLKGECKDRLTQRRLLYIKTVILTQEELIKERYLKTQSIDYLKYKYKCDNCIIGFNYKDNLEDHIQRKHTPKSDTVICDLCLQVTIKASHNLNHYTRYECVCCKKRFHEYDDALKHYRKQHGFRKIERKCRFCDYSVYSKIKLKVHIENCHNKFKCEMCGVSLPSLTSRKWHKMVKHEKKCTQCELHFATSNEFCKHMKRYHAYCAECDVHFKSWYGCLSHMRFSVVHADKRKRYKCDDCGMRFRMESQLSQHINMKHKKTQQ